MNIIDKLKEQAKQNIKTIVLPESDDIRVLQACEKIEHEGFAKIILLGDENEIRSTAVQNNIQLINTQIIDIKNDAKKDEYAAKLYELRKAKGMTEEEAYELVTTNSRYYATMMVKEGDADGFVSGAAHTTSDTLKPALQVIKGAAGVDTVSAFFIMVLPDKEFGEDGTLIFADCGMNENPTSDQLADIAIQSAKSFKELVSNSAEPKVAMLSYSTKGSAKSELTEKVVNATAIAKDNAPELFIDGELQLDAALVPEVAASKAPGSSVAGKANILVFPDLNAGNIGYKLAQRLGHAQAYGPLCQGMAKPVNDLSRGCSADDIVGVVAITCVQAQGNQK